MRVSAKKFVNHFFKLLLWIIGVVIVLFVSIVLLIQLPAVQNKIISYATNYVSNKTHTRVEIERVGITFPKSIFLNGVFLEDQHHDTLIYAGKIKVDIDMMGLLKSKVYINSLLLKDVNGRITRTENDSLFNFNFLITALTNPDSKPAEKDTTQSKLDFNVNVVNLENIRFIYDDRYAGIVSDLRLNTIDLNVDKLDLETQTYEINKLFVDGFTGNLAILKQSSNTDTSSTALPIITAKSIEIKNVNYAYADQVNKQSVKTVIGEFRITKANINLSSENISADELTLSHSNLQLNFPEASKPNVDSVLPTNTKVVAENKWQLALKNLKLDNNTFAYNVVNLPAVRNAFDPAHVNYQQIFAEAKDIFYSSSKITAAIQSFTANDPKGISIKEFSTDFYMDLHNVTADHLKIKTANSDINANAKMEFSSFESLKDSIGELFITADMQKVKVHTKDILYFAPQLAAQPFFKGGYNYASVSGKVKGKIKNLHGDKIVLHTTSKTLLTTDFVITGLPDAEKAYFSFPNLKFISGRSDLVAILGNKIIPANIQLPANINLNAKFNGQLKAFESSFSLGSEYGTVSGFAVIDKQENFKSDVNVDHFDLGKLLKNDTLFGPVTLSANVAGHGLDKKTMTANIKANASQIYLNQYNYHALTIDGKVRGQEFDGKISLNDSNIAFDFSGLLNLNKGEEQYKFTLDLKGADLKNLKLTNEDIRIGLIAVTDLKGSDMNTINGNAGITKIIVAKNGEKYVLDSVMFASINESRRSQYTINSALIGIKYNGTFAPGQLVKEIKNYFNQYFPVLETTEGGPAQPQKLNFEIQLHNHPVISAFFPLLTEFEPGVITGNFDSEKKILRVKANINNLVYASTAVRNLNLDVNGDDQKLSYMLTCKQVSAAQVRLENFTVEGAVKDKAVTINVSSIDDDKNKKLLVQTSVTKEAPNYKIIVGSEFYLANQQWNIANDNYVLVGNEGLLIHNFSLSRADQNVTVTSVNNRFNDDLSIKIKSFQLADVSHIIDKDTNLIAGIVNADVLLKRINKTYGIIADASVNNLAVRQINVGNLALKASNSSGEKFDVNAKLSGAGNELNLDGYMITKDSTNTLNINTDIQSLSMKTVEAFSFGQVKDADGNMRGQFIIKGTVSDPDINGSLTFDNVYANPVALNNRLHFTNETLKIKSDGVYFSSFTVYDQDGHSAVIDGAVNMTHFSNYRFDLELNTNDFLVFNTTQEDNKLYFGRMIIDSRIKIGGTIDLPVVTSNVKLKEGSNFTFAVPEQKLTTDKGEDVVLFIDSLEFHRIITRNEEVEKEKSPLRGYDISSNIEVDDKATLRLLIDPSTSDSLVVRGNAALTFALDPSGKISLTGSYELTDGSYLVTLQSIIKKQFKIQPGSTITWNGDVMDADLNITAIYSIRTSPADLVADQVGGLSDAERNVYRQRLPFNVLLKMTGALMKPEINFAIELPQEEKGAMGGTVNAKLIQLNEDPSALNKQVFALLVLNRFIQENPLETAGGSGAATVARNSVSKFLSAELNQLGSKFIPGVELNFDVQSYEDYSTGSAQGRTEVEIGLRKQLLNERVEVQVGGSIDVEGDRAKQNNASDITGDVVVEYKLTEDGRYRLKGFRHNQYEGAMEGQITETGGGVLYTRDFEKWKDFFTRPKKAVNKKEKLKDPGSNEAGPN